MARSKKIFLLLSAIFLTIVGFVSYDIARRTTFPGSKPQLPERIKEQFKSTPKADSDSIPPVRR